MIGAGLIQLIVIAIVIAGVVGIALVVAKAAGLEIPSWFFSVLWIVVAVVIGVVAIRFIASLL